MSRYGTYDLKYGFIPDDDCPQQETPKHTNGDKIRAMTDEELAHLIGGFLSCENCPAHSDVCEMDYEPEDMPTCEQIWIEWLKQEAKEGET